MDISLNQKQHDIYTFLRNENQNIYRLHFSGKVNYSQGRIWTLTINLFYIDDFSVKFQEKKTIDRDGCVDVPTCIK